MTTKEDLRPASGPGAGWAGRLLAAARVVSDHGELWLPGALATMSSIGWLPFVLAVVPAPSDGDLAFLASSIVLAPNFPLNVILSAGALICVALSASVLSATGEAVLLRAIDRLRGVAPGSRSIDDEAARLWLIRLLASLPALAVAFAALAVVAGVAPGEYQSPDLGQGPLLVRLARDVWPLLVIELAAIVLGQALAAGAVRASIGPPQTSVRGALGAGLRGLLHPLRRVAMAAAMDVALGAWLVVTWALLRVLWTPIGRHVGDGTLLTPGSVALLVGFVAIWLCLVAGGGVLHAWSSTWSSLEEEAPEIGAPREDGGDRWT